MSQTLIRIYALLVCFVTVVCITITTGIALYQIVKIINPELTMNPYQYQHLLTDAAYRRAHPPTGHMIPPAHVTGQGSLAKAQPDAPAGDTSEQRMTEIRKNELAALIESERKFSIASLIRLSIVLLVTCPLFYVHWRLARRPEATAG